MPRIFDNITSPLDEALRATLKVSYRCDFCVGYFNLRGWRRVADYMETWSGADNNRCRLLVGMQQPPENLIRDYYSPGEDDEIDNRRAAEIRKKLAQNFRQQLTLGVPTAEDEKHLRQLQQQLRDKKVVVKLYLRHTLHAKLYLLFRDDFNNPITGYLGSSNLTLSGLAQQGELNLDVVDDDATKKLSKWFDDRWKDRFCVDITEELIAVLDESWVRDKLPYHIYLKMAYHLASDARAGVAGFRVPAPFDEDLLDFQKSAVLMAARHLDKRGGVLIGDVVGLGKTITAAALVKLFEQRDTLATLIICPKNLVGMWQGYVKDYELNAQVIAITTVQNELEKLRRFRLVVIDESHNLRNREGKRYRAIREYLRQMESKVILLSATPYNKAYADISNQLRLFIPDDLDLGQAPEHFIRSLGGPIEFAAQYQYSPRTLAAFDNSEFADDWQELLRLFMVRRTRSFIKEHYATLDPDNKRRFLTFKDGTRSYFPDRVARKVEYGFAPEDETDQYARLYSTPVVDALNALGLPRYGLGQYEKQPRPTPKTDQEKHDAQVLDNLSRAGKRLKGFCRTNLFKRLESSGQAFLLSLSRHILRNYVFIHAIDNNLPLPIGQQDAQMLDSWLEDEDPEELFSATDEQEGEETASNKLAWNITTKQYKERADSIYAHFAGPLKKRFRWIKSEYFTKALRKELMADAVALQKVLALAADWDPAQDRKLNALEKLCQITHPKQKILVFTQFADTACYLDNELQRRKVKHIAGVTGSADDPTDYARRFSPVSNKQENVAGTDHELRVLVSTDVLSEGQNLQDSHVIVNYDLPWAIIRLIQRAGRVDRIGQQAKNIFCYSFLPEDGIEQIIQLRTRLTQRLEENAEVVGTDEIFMEEDITAGLIRNLYNERSDMYNQEPDGEVDLASYAWQIWKNASDADPKLHKIIPDLAPVSHTTRAKHSPDGMLPGVLLYARTANDNDMLVWVDRKGEVITQSQFTILRAAACTVETPLKDKYAKHHELVAKALSFAHDSENSVGGQLGPKTSARYRTYHILMRHHDAVKNLPLFNSETLKKAIEELYRFPLRESARDGLNRLLKTSPADAQVAQFVMALYEEGLLGIVTDDGGGSGRREPQILCSMGLV
ncbi:NgoFVII family restriction endonuclease [Hymenobacter sp. UV11]|nr:helicase-related protein [Hymenobacter sp. UV11]TDN39884.1 NgoFVII family restriction endonuclease [Hymenobacter sp. UV11]TFZ63259.1 NgoFVII family restriction endonuclease [Hymenobacter sp. UV11]